MTQAPDSPLGAHDFLRMEVATYLRRTQGRETFCCGPSPGFPEGCIVKRTSPEGWPWFRAWRGRAARSAGRREHDNLVALDRIGVRVPRAFAWATGSSPGSASRRASVVVASVVVMERVRHNRTLRDALEVAGASERRRLGTELLALVARMHAQGFHHRDLYLQHVIVRADDGALVLIDVGRVRRGRRARWLVKDLAALLHSTPARVTPREELRFAVGWLDAQGVTGRGARRRWLRAIVRKRLRIAAHVPRDERAR
jgi:tRNA A-37 threonylcarbamoyl transferase component Bud32